MVTSTGKAGEDAVALIPDDNCLNTASAFSPKGMESIDWSFPTLNDELKLFYPDSSFMIGEIRNRKAVLKLATDKPDAFAPFKADDLLQLNRREVFSRFRKGTW